MTLTPLLLRRRAAQALASSVRAVVASPSEIPITSQIHALGLLESAAQARTRVVQRRRVSFCARLTQWRAYVRAWHSGVCVCFVHKWHVYFSFM